MGLSIRVLDKELQNQSSAETRQTISKMNTMDGFTISQFIFAVGTILLIRKIFKKREILNGYDIAGSFITLIAMSVVLGQFVLNGDIAGTVAGSMQWFFWLFAVVFSLRNRKQNA
jgi:hypothetical protein